MKEIINFASFLAMLFIYTLGFAADAETDTKLRAAIATVVQSLPMPIDKRTTLISMILEPGHVLTYRYSVDMAGMMDDAATQGNLTRAQLLAGLERKAGSEWPKVWAEQYIFPYILKNGCSQPVTQTILKLGYSISHTMINADGTYLFERTIKRNECNI
ncbi:hypothetical protein [Pseudomonas brassicacearum]|uniref:hypothetical protein n=1 Tax=Pseudomonas brassicacearum TaxID=930166 RepID=UPI000F4786FA|nr:hypothetical protein [Pseudomonas brassicacearum]ROM98913.1 hypothetical protein BK657_21575 [Pseudomonas brassicacearum]